MISKLNFQLWMVDNGYNKMVGWAEPEYQPLGFIPLQSDTGHMQSAFKGTVSVILSDPPWNNDSSWFTTVPLKLCLIKFELDIHVFVSSKWLISFVVSL